MAFITIVITEKYNKAQEIYKEEDIINYVHILSIWTEYAVVLRRIFIIMLNTLRINLHLLATQINLSKLFTCIFSFKKVMIK